MTRPRSVSRPVSGSRMGRYVPAPPVQRLTPARQKTRHRNWTSVDVRSVAAGDVLAAFGTPEQTRLLFDRVASGGRPRVNPELLARLVMAGGVLGLSLRKLEGFARSIARLVGVDVTLVPDHTTICRFITELDYQALTVWMRHILLIRTPVVVSVAVDATGLAVRTSGGWVSDKPGGLGKRPGRYDKWHVVCDTETGFVLGWELTRAYGSGSADVAQGPDLIRTAAAATGGTVAVVCADGAYTSAAMFDAATSCGASLLVPLKASSVYGRCGPRNLLLTQQSRIGEGEWKKRSGYHQRSQVENVFSVTKTGWGNRLRAKTVTNRLIEIAVHTEWRNHTITTALQN